MTGVMNKNYVNTDKLEIKKLKDKLKKSVNWIEDIQLHQYLMTTTQLEELLKILLKQGK